MTRIRAIHGCRAAFAATALLAGASHPGAQSIDTLLLDGDTIPGLPGTVNGIHDLAVNDNGDWMVALNMSGNLEAVCLNGIGILVEGDDLPEPPGTTVEDFDDIELDAELNIYWDIDTSASASFSQVFYRGLTRLSQEGNLVKSTSFTSGTIWKKFTAFQLNSLGEVLMVGQVDDPAVPGGTDVALVLMTFDANGDVLDEKKLLLEDDRLPGTNDEYLQIGASNAGHDIAFSAEHWMCYVRLDSGSTNDECVLMDGVLLARESSLGPLAGSFWSSLSLNALSLNDAGDYIYRGRYDQGGVEDIDVLMKNGVPFLTEGDISDSIAPFGFLQFGGNAPIMLDKNGNVFFWGETTNTDASLDNGLFRNDQIIIQESTTMIGSAIIGGIANGANIFDISPSGRYMIFEAQLSDGTGGAFLIDFGLIEDMEACSTNASSLRHTDGFPVLGETVGFEMDLGQDLGVTPFFLLSTAPIVGWPPCGFMTLFGEILIDFSPGNGNPAIVLPGAPWTGAPSAFSVAVPKDTALLNRNFFAQGFFWDFGDQSPAINFQLTNGLRIELAP